MAEKSDRILSAEMSVLVVVDIQDKLHAAIEGKDDVAKQAIKMIKVALSIPPFHMKSPTPVMRPLRSIIPLIS